jgi:16S rRNA C967 or C1407 C5-methylase (RsmB/RsmF family)
VAQTTVEELQKHASYQRKFIKEAVALLKPGGFLTYSTCTINSEENEQMVRHILQDYPVMNLLPIRTNIGQAGLAGCGLSDDERSKVRRFDPHFIEADTMGFFIALFQRKEA